MSLKDLKRSLPDVDTIPQLAVFYMSACESVYGNRPFVHRKHYSLFSVFEDDLRELHISPRDYADKVVRITKKFVLSKKWKYLPFKLFLSDYGLKRYQKLKKTKTVEIADTSKESLLYNELMVARVFVERNINGNNFTRFGTIVEELKPLLSEEWLQCYKDKSKRPDSEAIDTLAIEYNVKFANSYLDIVDALRNG